jgi:hypothetical protein
MDSRYSVFMPYYGKHASQYEEDAVRLLSIIKDLNPEAHITFAQLDGALIRSGLSPRSLYEQAITGRYTSDMARLDTELGLPAKTTTPECVGYWQQQLVEMARRDGKSQEMIDNIDADLERALASGLGLFYSKEDIAQSIVQVFSGYSTPLPSIDAEPTKPTRKAPYYHKDKQKWWK